jgi:hypothetical protein
VVTRVSGPVLEALSENKLKEKFPFREWDAHRQDCTCTEAFARTLAGVALWVELGPDATPEGKLREKFGLLARRSLAMPLIPILLITSVLGTPRR